MMNRNRNSLRSNSINRAASRPLESVQEEFPSCSYTPSEGSCFKENVDVNKSGNLKLNLEPLQMKRKKKGGGCNLRKSLAWDRAFFTEEGVLDPLELSIITGASCGEASPGINNGTPSSSKQTLKPTGGQSSQKIKPGFGSKLGSNSGGCPRTLSSSSIKRTGNLNNVKSAVKESKLQKVPSSKTVPTPIQTSKRKIPRPTSLYSCQNDQSAFTIQTNRASLGNSSKTLKPTRTAPKVDTLQPVCHLDANSNNSCFGKHTSSNPSQTLADEDSDSKIIAVNKIPSGPVHSVRDTGISMSASTSFTRHPHDSGLNMHSSQNQTMKPSGLRMPSPSLSSQNQAMKPSGLRMPSPSLSFFSKPKAPSPHDLSSRDADSSIFESLKPGNLRLQENLRTSQNDNNILHHSSSNNKSVGISSRSGCSVPPNVNVASCETVRSNLGNSSIHQVEMKVSSDALNPYILRCESTEDGQIQDHSTNSIGSVSAQEAEVQNIDKQMHSESVDGSSDRWGRNSDLVSESNHGIHGSERESASEEPVKEPSTSIPGVHNHDASSIGTSSGSVLDPRCQNQMEMLETICERNCYELHKENTDQGTCSPVLTDNTALGDENALETKEIATEISDGSPLSGTRYSVSKHSNAELKNECEFLSDEAVCRRTVTKSLLECEEYLPKEELPSTVGGCRDNLVISDDHTDLERTRSEGKTTFHEVDLELEANEGICIRDRMSVVGTEMRWQSENDLNIHDPKAVFLHDLAARRLLSNHYHSTSQVIIPGNNDCSSFPVTRMFEVPCREYLSNIDDVILNAKDYGENTCGSFIMPSEEIETNMDNQSNKAAETLLVQPPSINEHVNQSVSSEFIAENLSLSNDGWNLEKLFLTKSTSCEYSEENILNGVMDSFELGESMSTKARVCSPESPFRHESRFATDANGSSSRETLSDSSFIKPLNTVLDHPETPEQGSGPVNDLQCNSNDLQSEAVLSPNNNNHVDGSITQIRKLVLPQNAVPFSDEWLAAIEAAGEDILTKKGGAVQNSPTEKSIPEPSPWSPVKKKNNQIGPFDCTKCTNILPADPD